MVYVDMDFFFFNLTKTAEYFVSFSTDSGMVCDVALLCFPSK